MNFKLIILVSLIGLALINIILANDLIKIDSNELNTNFVSENLYKLLHDHSNIITDKHKREKSNFFKFDFFKY